MRTGIVVLLVLAGSLAAFGQVAGTAVGTDLPNGSVFAPLDQPLFMPADGSYIAVQGSSGPDDIVVIPMDETGQPGTPVSIDFPGFNLVSQTNTGLAISRTGSFICCYGSVSDVIFISRNTSGSWFGVTIDYPGGEFVPVHGGTPVISEDESFIVCRSTGTTADLVIIPIDYSSGFPFPGAGYGVSFPSGNFVDPLAINPVITKNSNAIAIHGATSLGELVVVEVGRPLISANTVAYNVDLPGGNFSQHPNVPPVASPNSNYFAVHGVASVADLVVIPLNAQGTPQTAVNVDWPTNNFTTSFTIPPVVSENGRLLVVNASSTSGGSLVALPIDMTGTPGTPVNVIFPANNTMVDTQVPPVMSRNGGLVLQRGQAALGDLVATQVTFTNQNTVTTTSTNILYPSSNNLPSIQAGIALARDASFCATLGLDGTGDLVVTPFDASFGPLPSVNVLYPSNNGLNDLMATPSISRDGNLIVTGGSSVSGPAVLTCMDINQMTGFRTVKSVENIPYPSGAQNQPILRQPVFSPTGQFVATGSNQSGQDVVTVPLLNVVPHIIPGRPGDGALVRLYAPNSPNMFFFAAPTFSPFPGTTLSDGRFVPITDDALFQYSLTANPVFLGFVGLLDANGVGEALINLRPLNIVNQDALEFYVSFFVIDLAATDFIGEISQAAIF